MIGVNRRRYMGGKGEEMAFTKETNAPMLAVCYAQHWCASPDYMTKAEAAAVTNIGSAFSNNADITFFDLSCFISLTTIYNGTTYRMTSCVDMALPSSLTTIGNNFMNTAADIEYFVVNEGCTSIGNALGIGNNNTKLFVLPSTLTSLGSLYKGTSSQLPHADLIMKSVTPPGGRLGASSLWDYVYVPDESIQAYQTAYSGFSNKIYGKSELPDKYRRFWP